MHNYNWLHDRIDITGVKLYNFREKDFLTVSYQPAGRNPTRLQMFNQLQKTVEFRNELNNVVANLEKLLDGKSNNA